MGRYNHWFWNSCFLDWIGHKTTQFNSWLWRKQYNNH